MRPYGATNAEYLRIILRRFVFIVISVLFAALMLYAMVLTLFGSFGLGLFAFLVSVAGLWGCSMALTNYKPLVHAVMTPVAGFFLAAYSSVLSPWLAFIVVLLMLTALWMIMWELPGSRI
jgi:hypothetical protein